MVKPVCKLRVIDSVATIRSKIRRAIIARLSHGRVLERAMVYSAVRVRKLFIQEMKNSPTYQALTSNHTLVGELGLVDPQSKIDAIIDKMAASIKIKLKKGRSNSIGGGFTIKLVKANFKDILRIPEAKQRATSIRPRRGGASLLPWLEWMLLRGDEKIIMGYTVKFGAFAASRTGLALMYKRKEVSKSWSVPHGNWKPNIKNNNFITRVLDEIVDQVAMIIVIEMQKAARRA